jgi:hypothetical protein
LDTRQRYTDGVGVVPMHFIAAAIEEGFDPFDAAGIFRAADPASPAFGASGFDRAGPDVAAGRQWHGRAAGMAVT